MFSRSPFGGSSRLSHGDAYSSVDFVTTSVLAISYEELGLRYACLVAHNHATYTNMYNIKSRYEKIATKHPLYSTYTVFAETIRNTNLTENSIRRHFHRLVDKEDYAKNEKPAVLRYLVSIAKLDKIKTAPGTT